MASNTPIKEDPKELANAEKLWGNFMVASKWSILIIVVIVLGLAVSFVSLGS